MSDMLNRRRIFFPILHLLILIFQNALAKKDFETDLDAKRSEIGYFWHVSDVFFDPTYSPLGTPENDCHVGNATNFTKNCGFFGELGQCSAFGLVETIARAMNSTRWRIASPEFCIFTGNLRCPNPEKDEADGIYETMSAFITDIQNAGFVNVYPSYGWYDYHPYGHHPLKLTALYDKLKNLLHKQKSNSSILRHLGPKSGYFSRVEQPQNKIRVVVMNTNFYIREHIASRLPDPAGQWKWMRNELRKCRIADQKAFIVMSVPPGVNRESREGGMNLGDDLTWRDKHNQRYLRVIDEFEDVIAAQFSGHRNEDSFRLVYNKNGKAVSVILMAPAISPSFGNYPAMRIYMYDKNSGKILDFVQYYFNLTKGNFEADVTRPEKYWEVSYSFRDFYLLPDATIPSFEKLIKNFQKNDAVFQRYYRNAEGLHGRKYTCRDRCKLVSFCSITTIDSGSFFECVSGESTAHDQRIRQSQPPPEPLRNRLIHGDTNSVSVSGSGAAASMHYVILLFLYAEYSWL